MKLIHKIFPESKNNFLHTFVFFFFYLGFLSISIHKSQDNRGRGRPILSTALAHTKAKTLLYHILPLQENWDITRTITDESLSLHITNDWNRTRNPLVSRRKSLITKLCTLIWAMCPKLRVLFTLKRLALREETAFRIRKFFFMTNRNFRVDPDVA